jgi:hypothetical protein
MARRSLMSKNNNQYKYDAENDKEYFSRDGGVSWSPYSSSDTGWQKLVKKLNKLFSGYTNTAAANLTKDEVIKHLNDAVNLLSKERNDLINSIDMLNYAANQQRVADPLNRGGDGSEAVQIANYIINIIDEAEESYDDIELENYNNA